MCSAWPQHCGWVYRPNTCSTHFIQPLASLLSNKLQVYCRLQSRAKPDSVTGSCSCRSLTASKGKKRLLEELPAEASRRVTRHLATQAQRSDQASAAETDGEAPLRSETVSSRTANQSPAMHTPLDTAYGSATGNATPRMRAVTRAAAAAGISLPEAAAAAGRAGVTPAGKPPLPPTASRTVSAYRSAHRQRTGPIAMGMPTVKTRASSPGLGAPASFPPSSPTSSLAAAAAADESTGRPVTRRSAQQQGLTNPPGTQPSGGARDAETVPTPTARGRDKRAAAEVGPDQAGNDHCSPGSASGNLTLERRTQPAVRGKLGGVSKKRRAEVSLAVLESQGEQC